MNTEYQKYLQDETISEIFRVAHDKYSFHALMKQTYDDKPDFYWVYHSGLHSHPHVDKSGSIGEIIVWYCRHINNLKNTILTIDDDIIREIYEQCLLQDSMFMDKLVELL